jgi:hypothetical protein
MTTDQIKNNSIHKIHKIIVVTPAGRRRYLEILSKYILADKSIDEWHLWDNCRREDDRAYLNKLAESFSKIKIIRIDKIDGSTKSINKFYKFITDEEVFYIRIDDDIVFMEKNFGYELYKKALETKDKYLWWSPLVINNALCTYYLFCKDILKTNYPLTAQCTDNYAHGSPFFAEKLHNWFIDVIRKGELDKIKSEGIDISISRFSVNCIGFFGERMKSLGQMLLPLGDEEEWISATLPVKLNLPGRLVGDLIVSHFAFFTQEAYLLNKTKILNEYARIAGINHYEYKKEKIRRDNIIKEIKSIFRSLCRIFELNTESKFKIFPINYEK